MCGIAGLVNLRGQPVETAHLRRMIEKVAHRGPDLLAESLTEETWLAGMKRYRGAIKGPVRGDVFFGYGSRAEQRASGMKNKGVRVFTVAVMPDATSEALLHSCASSGSDYFNVADGAALRASFQNIASQLQNLRVTQ